MTFCSFVIIGLLNAEGAAHPGHSAPSLGFASANDTVVKLRSTTARELLVEVKRRGLIIAPEIAIGDGALGWKALDEIYPGTRHERCFRDGNEIVEGSSSRAA